jgi:hypothetical protein
VIVVTLVDYDKATKMGRNELLFRQVNERLRELGEGFSVVAERADFVCECADERCMEPIQLTLGDYERVRSDPRWFVVIRGHERPEVEFTAWDIGERILVVQKTDEVGDAAIAEDPRQ